MAISVSGSDVEIQLRLVDVHDSGLACLAMALEALGEPVEMARLRQRVITSQHGMTIESLAEAANGLGLSTRLVEFSERDFGHLMCPAVVCRTIGGFALLKRIRGNRGEIYDPDRGTIWLRKADLEGYATGAAIELSQAPAFKRRREAPPFNILSMVRFNRGITHGLLQALAVSILLEAYVIVSPLYLQIAIDNVSTGADLDLLNALVLGFAAFTVFDALAEALRGFALQRTSLLVGWDLSRRLFHHLVRLPLPWFHRRKLADVLTRFQSLNPIKSLITNGLAQSLIDGVLSLTTGIFMMLISPTLTIVALVAFFLYVCIRLVSLPLVIRKSAEHVRANYAEEGKRIEILRGMQAIKVMGGETTKENDWANQLGNSIRAEQGVAILKISFSSLQKLINGLEYVLIVYLGMRAVISSHMTVGILVAFVAYKSQFSARLVNVVEQFINLRMLTIYAFRVSDIALTPTERGVDQLPVGLPEVRGELEMRNVSFRYSPNDPLVLRNINLKVAPGEFVAIMGPSGAGKSTLLKVLCGLYPPTHGEILLDGLPISAWGPKAMRRCLGTVLQDDDLFPGTIIDNVTFFDQRPHLDRVWRCLKLACIEPEINSMPSRGDTLVGDMGSALSGGQKQRLLLARALYRQPRILLLDEATSHVQVSLDKQINAALGTVAATRVIVAHRPETVASASRVFMLTDTLREVKPLVEGTLD